MPAVGPLIYVTRTVPSYRVGILRQLNSRLNGRLVVCQGPPPHGSSLGHIKAELGTDLRVVHLKNWWIGGEKLHLQSLQPVFRAHGRPTAILAEESPRSISLPVLMAVSKARRIPIGLWGHFSSNHRAFSTTHPADLYRVSLARLADACICYTDGIAEMLKPHISASKLFVARNTLDTNALFDWHSRLSEEGKTAVRERLGLPADWHFVTFIGRLIKEKGTETLLRVVRRLQDTGKVGLVVIGDGPDRASMESKVAALNLQHIYFTGALPSYKESSPYLFASDVMLLPGYVGLAVNHAFALGLPVVTHASPGEMRYHSPEIEYVIDGYNGRIVQHADVAALAESTLEILADLPQFSARAHTYAQSRLKMEYMVDGLESAFRYLESSTFRSENERSRFG